MRHRFLMASLLLLASAMLAPASAQDVRNPAPVEIPTLFGTIIIGTNFPRETVTFTENQPAGTIIVNTKQRRLYYVLGNGKAIRYAIAVGKEGYSWSGTSTVSSKREWPDWNPPADMRQRRPDLPVHMAGGPNNPLGARALYLGDTLYRIHGTNEPWYMGTARSSGCIRMTNDDVIDLYNRTKIGATVIVRQ
ncbi:MAG TPA: L,D-transpeptidase [Xanthobacteraceae bacterium]|nr:L,D-transpeptidase [Xanthobacteraceae bacterium]